MIDKNSDEWKQYCQGLLDFDDHFEDGVFVVPSDPENQIKVDWPGLAKYIHEKHGGNSALMLEQEYEQFIIKPEVQPDKRVA